MLHYLSPGDDREVGEFSMMGQLIYSMEMAEAGRRERCSHPLTSPLALSRKRGLWHSLTLPLSQTERHHSWLCKHTSCQTAGWAIRNSVSIFCWYWVRFAFPCPGHSMCINKPLSRRDETHCRMEGCSAPVKLKAEVNGQSKRDEREEGRLSWEDSERFLHDTVKLAKHDKLLQRLRHLWL